MDSKDYGNILKRLNGLDLFPKLQLSAKIDLIILGGIIKPLHLLAITPDSISIFYTTDITNPIYKITWAQITGLIVSVINQEIIIQVNELPDLHFQPILYRSEIIQTLLQMYCTSLKISEKIKVWFIEEISLRRFAKTKRMINFKLNVDMTDEDYQQLNSESYMKYNEELDSANGSKPKPESSEIISQVIFMNDSMSHSVDHKRIFYDFQIKRLLGVNNYGEMVLAVNKVTEQEVMIRIENHEFLADEKNFIKDIKAHAEFSNDSKSNQVKYSLIFMTKYKIYCVVEIMKGGDLNYYVGKYKNLPEAAAQFYIASAIVSIGACHAKGFLYKDLKLENLLQDDDGWCKPNDFDIDKHFTKGKVKLTYHGSLFYIAPEVITSREFSQASDWWSIGVLAYEMLYGFPPWYSKDVNNLFMAISTREHMFFDDLLNISDEAKDFITKILEKDPKLRLGSKGNVEEQMSHSWFKNFNWSHQMDRNRVTPIKPFYDDSRWSDNYDKSYSNIDYRTTFISGTLEMLLDKYGGLTSPSKHKRPHSPTKSPQKGKAIPEPSGDIYIVVHQAKLLTDLDMGDKQMDPYVILKLGKISQKTKVANNQGQTPKWNEAFLFHKPSEMDLEQLVDIWDKDVLGSDFSSNCKIKVHEIISAGSMKKWFEVFRKDGTHEGEIELEFEYRNAEMKRKKIEDYKKMKILEKK